MSEQDKRKDNAQRADPGQQQRTGNRSANRSESLLPGDDAETRARAGAAVIGGLLSSFWVVGDATLAALPREELVRRFGAVLQSAIDA